MNAFHGFFSFRFRARPAEKDLAWEWLAENNPLGADIRTNSSSPVDAAWRLLEDVIDRLEVNLIKTELNLIDLKF